MRTLGILIVVVGLYLGTSLGVPSAADCTTNGRATQIASQIVTQWLRFSVGEPTSRAITQVQRADLRARIKHAILDEAGCP